MSRFKCRDKGCDGVIWPPKPEQKSGGLQRRTVEEVFDAEVREQEEELPF